MFTSKYYDNYVFDLYGTLVDIHTEESSPGLWRKLSLFYRFYNAEYTPGELKNKYFELVDKGLNDKKIELAVNYSHESYPELRIEEIFAELFKCKGIIPSHELVVHAGQLFRIESIRHLKVYPKVSELLAEIKKSGKKIYLLSNAQRIFTEYEMNALGISKYFDGILISSDEGYKKPDIRFYNLLKTRYSLDFSKSIMIGNDSENDIKGAIEVGMDTLYIRSNISPINDPTPCANYVFEEMNIKNVAKALGFKV